MGSWYNPNTMRVEYFPDYPQKQNNNNGLLWVSGEVGAKSWQVAPNSTVLLMDSEADRFYIKSSDASGMPTLRTYEYKEVNPQPIKTEGIEYVKKSDYDDLMRDFAEKLQKVEENIQKLTEKPKRKEATNEQ